jgi:hypothetical protein
MVKKFVVLFFVTSRMDVGPPNLLFNEYVLEGTFEVTKTDEAG